MIFHQFYSTVFGIFKNMASFPELVHGVFLRRAKVLPDAADRLNIGINSGSDPLESAENREAVSSCLGGVQLLFLSQVHGCDIRVLNSEEAVTSDIYDPPTADGFVADRKGIGLAIGSADCQAVILYDPTRRVIANVHAGWRGSIGNILGKCIETMKSDFQTSPADLIAAIGPSLGPCCAEFIHYRAEIPKIYWPYKTRHNLFNFWQISHDQLTEAGVPEAHIEWSGICTKCNPHLFFSYRHAGESGRFATVIGLKQ